VELLLQQLTDAEDALIVNNCAAAALLILSVLAGDGETIVSRGELVEIGGDFRVPDVMASSGTTMVEVGTTNRTHLEDYRRAINSRSRLLMRVHPSNYKIVGFASHPELSELVALAQEKTLPLYEDAGSGQMDEVATQLEEPTIASLIKAGVDVVSFSGDKLLGTVQAGLIVGKREIVSKLRRHPLYRALRSDKIRLAALEATLDAHVRGVAKAEIPAPQMLSLTAEAIRIRAEGVIATVTKNEALKLELLAGDSAVGGGAAPTISLPTTLISVSHATQSADEIEHRLRRSNPPIIARIAEDKVLIDLRTVFADEEPQLRQALASL
jgi:L-seryl-tRNA(Ser) seleniumtransferase